MRLSDKYVCIIILILAIAGFLVLFVYMKDYTMDDSYITYRYARHIADGHGIVWNVGEPPVEGYTNFAWMILLAGLTNLMNVELAAKIFCLISLLGILAAYYFMGRRFNNGRLVFCFAALFLLANPSTVLHSVSGMDTMFFSLFFLVTIFFAYIMFETKSLKLMPLYSVIGFLVTLIRPEGSLPVIVLAAILIFRERDNKGLMFFLLLFVLPILFYLLWKTIYFGDIIPLTFYYKVISGTVLKGLPTFLRVMAYASPFLAVIFLSFAQNRKLRNLMFVGIAGSFLVILIYILAARLSMNLLYRFYFPTFVVIYFLAAVSIASIKDMKKYALLILPILLVCANIHFSDELVDIHGSIEGISSVAEFSKSLKGFNYTMAAGDAGMYAYYPDMRFIDIGGLNDAYTAKHGYTSIEYLEETRPNLLLFIIDTDPKNVDIEKQIMKDWRLNSTFHYAKKNGFVQLGYWNIRGAMNIVVYMGPETDWGAVDSRLKEHDEYTSWVTAN